LAFALAAVVVELRFAPHDVVVRLALPEMPAFSTALFVDFMSGEMFPRIAHAFEPTFADELDENVDVVGHDDVAAESITLAVEMMQRPHDNPAQGCRAKQAFAVAIVEKSLHLAGEMGVVNGAIFLRQMGEVGVPVVVLWVDAMSAQPGIARTFSLAEDACGDGIGRAKCEEIADIRLFPMGKKTLRLIHGAVIADEGKSVWHSEKWLRGEKRRCEKKLAKKRNKRECGAPWSACDLSPPSLKRLVAPSLVAAIESKGIYRKQQCRHRQSHFNNSCGFNEFDKSIPRFQTLDCVPKSKKGPPESDDRSENW
jgi:hypothetical protein